MKSIGHFRSIIKTLKSPEKFIFLTLININHSVISPGWASQLPARLHGASVPADPTQELRWGPGCWGGPGDAPHPQRGPQGDTPEAARVPGPFVGYGGDDGDGPAGGAGGVRAPPRHGPAADASGAPTPRAPPSGAPPTAPRGPPDAPRAHGGAPHAAGGPRVPQARPPTGHGRVAAARDGPSLGL